MTAPLDSDGNVHLDGGDIIKISVGGFKPGTVVEVWLFSTPTQLGTAVVGADGTVSGEYRLPVKTKSGSHRVVVTAKMANGKPTTFTLGILVGDISTTSTLTRVLIAIPIALAVGFGFLLPNQVRRRRKIRSV
jgi:RsiW-degrading membrane proteinase PrsW (M82 family)